MGLSKESVTNVLNVKANSVHITVKNAACLIMNGSRKESFTAMDAAIVDLVDEKTSNTVTRVSVVFQQVVLIYINVFQLALKTIARFAHVTCRIVQLMVLQVFDVAIACTQDASKLI